MRVNYPEYEFNNNYRKKEIFSHGRYNRTYLYAMQEKKLYNDCQQKKAVQEVRTQEILQMV